MYILKILNLKKKKLIAIFAEAVEKLFTGTLHSNLQCWLTFVFAKLLFYRYFLKNQRLRQNIFDRASFSDFTIREIQKDLQKETNKYTGTFLLFNLSFLFV